MKMKPFNQKLFDWATGPQDERERLQTMQRLALACVWLYWLALLVGIGSLLAGWREGTVAMLVWLILGWVITGYQKSNDMSDLVINESERINPDNAKQVLRQARRGAWLMPAGLAVVFYSMIVSDNPKYAVGALFFVIPAYLLMVLGLSESARKRVKEALSRQDG